MAASATATGPKKKTLGTTKSALPKIIKNPLVVIAIVGAVLIGAYFMYSQTWGLNMNDRTAAAAYLDKKYGKSFVVQNDLNPKVHSALGDRPKFDGKAHATDDPTLTFWVGRQTDPVGEFKDNYLGVLWADQQRKPVGEFLATIFDRVPDYSVEIYPSDRIQSLPNGSVPDYATVLSQASPGEIQYDLSVKDAGDLTNANRMSHAEKVLELVKYLKTMNVKPGLRYVINTMVGGEKARYIYNLFDTQLDQIYNPKDVADHLDDNKFKGWE